MTKREDKKQNKRINTLEKRLQRLQKGKGKPAPKPKRRIGKAPVQKRKRAPQAVTSTLSKLGPVLGCDHVPGASIPITVMGKATRATDTTLALLCLVTGNPVRKGAGTVDNPYVPFGGLVIGFTASTGAIAFVVPFTDMTQAVTDAMVNEDTDHVKFNSMKMSLKYNGAHLTRQGTAFTINPPDKNSIERLTQAVTSAIETPSLGEFQVMDNLLCSDRYSRIHHFNDAVTLEEICPASHTWQPFTTSTNYLTGDTNVATRTVVSGGVYYVLPEDAAMIYIPLNSLASTYPQFTFSIESHVELALSGMPGIMSPTMPPSPSVTNAVHSLKTSIYRAAQHHDIPQKMALSKYAGAWKSISTFSRSSVGKQIGRTALTAGLSMLAL